MNYRIVKVTSYYRDFLKEYYNQNPGITNQSYEIQLANLMSECYAWSNFYSKHLRELGNEAFEIVSNAEPLQNQWAKEHGSQTRGSDIVFDQLKVIKPEVVFFQDSFTFNGEKINQLRENVPSIKLVIGNCCSIFNDEYLAQFKAFDFMNVCSRKFYEDFTKAGIKANIVLHAFEDTILDRINSNNNFPEVDFIFLGSFIPGFEWHDLRQKVVNQLIKAGIDINIYAHIQKIAQLDLFSRRSAFLLVKLLKSLQLDNLAKILPVIKKAYYLNEFPQNPKNISNISRITKSPVYGINMLKALSKAKIGFNMHAEIAGDFAANIRLFEITGAGSCMITDWKKNMPELFEIDKEVVTFRTAEECIEKVKWLSDHPKEREDIAKAGQKRVLKDHTFRNRAIQLNEIILNELKK
jgi:spore maturation protein CgeB